MPPPPTTTKPSYHVLLTGYGPFSYVTDNPSWLAVAPLHDTLIHTPSATIHVTTFGPIPVTYTAVLALVQGVHARPPQLPPSAIADPHVDRNTNVDIPPPPSEGYDFTLHLGAGRVGALSLEQVGHKSGYRNPGVDGRLASVIPGSDTPHSGSLLAPSDAERYETERLRADREGDEGEEAAETSSTKHPEPLRGFGEGYECFPEELHTEVDVPGVLAHLERQGENRVIASEDAGHYLCDFLCYGSLAESQRVLYECSAPTSISTSADPPKRSKSLFMHVPHEEHRPHSITEMTEAVRQVVAWVCTGEAALPV